MFYLFNLFIHKFNYVITIYCFRSSFYTHIQYAFIYDVCSCVIHIYIQICIYLHIIYIYIYIYIHIYQDMHYVYRFLDICILMYYDQHCDVFFCPLISLLHPSVNMSNSAVQLGQVSCTQPNHCGWFPSSSSVTILFF